VGDPIDSTFDELPALRGRAVVFGDRVAAEAVLPRGPEHLPPQRAAAFVMTGIDATFPRTFMAGDFIIAGEEFAAGAACTITAAALQAAGVAAVIARSFGRVFAQAASNVGLPALVIEEAAAIQPGDRLRVDIEGRKIVNLSSGDRYVVRNLTDRAIAILRTGGQKQYARRAQGSADPGLGLK
jgi:3-isopropylmalate/(R)-2-methylmalate dehydratase small subunit